MSMCNSCNVGFASDEDKASHYATEFHSINAKRRAAELPPITTSGYERLKQQQADEAKAAEEADAEVLYICEACHKTFGAEGQFTTHNASKRHREKVKELLAARKSARQAEKDLAAAGGVDATTAGGGTEEGGGEGGTRDASPPAPGPGELVIGANNCVFCWKDNGDIESNLVHMQVAHSFYVPDVRQCVEPEGLVEYLHGKVVDLHACIYCTGNKRYDSPEATRQHMLDRGHCLMLYEDDADFEEYEEFYDYGGEEDEEGGESEEGNTFALVLPGSEEMAGLAGAAADLPLRSGGVARHRALMRYYKQRVVVPDEKRASLHAAMRRLAIDSKVSGAGRGSADKHLPMSTRFNVGSGVRGNRTNASSQRGVEKRGSHFDLHVGMWQNKILRRFYRIQAANTLS